MGERRLCKPEVVGSIPSASTSLLVVRMVQIGRDHAVSKPSEPWIKNSLALNFVFLDEVWAGVVTASRRKANRCLLFVIVNMMLSGLHVRSVALRDLLIASDRLGM